MWGRTEVEVRREWCKWRVDGRLALSGSSRGRVHRVGEGGQSDW